MSNESLHTSYLSVYYTFMEFLCSSERNVELDFKYCYSSLFHSDREACYSL